MDVEEGIFEGLEEIQELDHHSHTGWMSGLSFSELHNYYENFNFSKPKRRTTPLDFTPFSTLTFGIALTQNQPCVMNKDLKLVLQKELKPSDVGTLGRIVLPKKDAEANLPYLVEREGIIMQMKDMDSDHAWKMRFRFWPNNKSRMYLLEKTGDFVKYHQLRQGDFIMIYKDNVRNKFIISARKVSQLDGMISMGKRSLQPRHALHFPLAHSYTNGETSNQNEFLFDSELLLPSLDDDSTIQEIFDLVDLMPKSLDE